MKETLKPTSVNIRTEMREMDGVGYKYDLTMRESLHIASYGIPLYSIAVSMRTDDGQTTSANAVDIFASSDKAIAFFEKLVANLVTPIDLPYVIEDELSK